MKRLLIACLFLAGCAGASQDAVLASSCEGFNRTLATLNTFKPTMNETQLGIVDEAVEIVPPLCKQGMTVSLRGGEFDYAAAIESVRLYMRRLAIIEQGVE